MGNYNISVEDLIDPLEDFLRSQEGDISAEILCKCWNALAKKYDWNDKLKVIKK